MRVCAVAHSVVSAIIVVIRNIRGFLRSYKDRSLRSRLRIGKTKTICFPSRDRRERSALLSGHRLNFFELRLDDRLLLVRDIWIRRTLIGLARSHFQTESVFHGPVRANARGSKRLLRGVQRREWPVDILALPVRCEHLRDSLG